MGATLNIMIKVKFLLCVFILSSCSISKELRDERKSWNFNRWEKEYKDRAFCLCVLKGYENKEIEKILWEKDRSFYNPLGRAIFDKSLKPVIDNEIEKIRLDSINSTYPEDLKGIYQKKQVFNHCLKFYNSKELDKLAKKERENWKKIPNILDEVHKEIPTY
ncbi:putative iron-regulated protein [Chryseobacterium defluvii]|uniref:Putative iron-regulated protein n=1 Tax=Chryseobacterium defluvii TaxID=160396 RepID=A0A840KA45_9FLAO|nr:hypothetical protein [Chryseobacterium defluvii]MBB4804877.1 putative iron-regulated protein [Chryseobacterium defluvii]